MNKKQNKKIIAPIVIVVIMVLFIILQFVAPVFMLGLAPLGFISPVAGFFMFGIPIVVIAIALYVLDERIKEIRSGQEDDLGKY